MWERTFVVDNPRNIHGRRTDTISKYWGNESRVHGVSVSFGILWFLDFSMMIAHHQTILTRSKPNPHWRISCLAEWLWKIQSNWCFDPALVGSRMSFSSSSVIRVSGHHPLSGGSHRRTSGRAGAAGPPYLAFHQQNLTERWSNPARKGQISCKYWLRISLIRRHSYTHGGWSRNLVWKNIWDIVAQYKEQHQLKWHKCYLSPWPDGAACCCPACGPISIDNHIDKFFLLPPILG